MFAAARLRAMSKAQTYAELAGRFARLSAEAAEAAERNGYRSLAAFYLRLAKDAAAIEVRAERPAAEA